MTTRCILRVIYTQNIRLLESCQHFVAAPIRSGVHTDYWWLVGSAEAFAPSSSRFMPFLGLWRCVLKTVFSKLKNRGHFEQKQIFHIVCKKYRFGDMNGFRSFRKLCCSFSLFFLHKVRNRDISWFSVIFIFVVPRSVRTSPRPQNMQQQKNKEIGSFTLLKEKY